MARLLLCCLLFHMLLHSTEAISSKPAPALGQSSDQDEHLTVSAVVSDPQPPHHARIQCWQLADPFSRYPTVGRATYLAEASNVTYVVLPPRSEEGYHRPPHPM